MAGLGQRRGTEAFTLVEMMIAGLLLLMVLGAILAAYLQSSYSAMSARTYQQAGQAAAAELERLRSLPYSNLVEYVDVDLDVPGLAGLDAVRSCEVVMGADDVYREVTVTVSWQNPARSSEASLSYSALICRDGN